MEIDHNFSWTIIRKWEVAYSCYTFELLLTSTSWTAPCAEFTKTRVFVLFLTVPNTVTIRFIHDPIKEQAWDTSFLFWIFLHYLRFLFTDVSIFLGFVKHRITKIASWKWNTDTRLSRLNEKFLEDRRSLFGLWFLAIRPLAFIPWDVDYIFEQALWWVRALWCCKNDAVELHELV